MVVADRAGAVDCSSYTFLTISPLRELDTTNLHMDIEETRSEREIFTVTSKLSGILFIWFTPMMPSFKIKLFPSSSRPAGKKNAKLSQRGSISLFVFNDGTNDNAEQFPFSPGSTMLLVSLL